MNALPILLLGGAALLMMGGKKKPKNGKTNGKTTSEGDPTIDGGPGTGTPWFLMVYYTAKTQVEERAKDCSNPQGFRAAVYPALKKRLDEYRDDAITAGNVGFGENEAGGLAFKSDLQMLFDNLFTMHCG